MFKTLKFLALNLGILVALGIVLHSSESFAANQECWIHDRDYTTPEGYQCGRNVNFKETPLTKKSSEVHDEEIQSVKRWGAPDHP